MSDELDGRVPDCNVLQLVVRDGPEKAFELIRDAVKLPGRLIICTSDYDDDDRELIEIVEFMEYLFRLAEIMMDRAPQVFADVVNKDSIESPGLTPLLVCAYSELTGKGQFRPMKNAQIGMFIGDNVEPKMIFETSKTVKQECDINVNWKARMATKEEHKQLVDDVSSQDGCAPEVVKMFKNGKLIVISSGGYDYEVFISIRPSDGEYVRQFILEGSGEQINHDKVDYLKSRMESADKRVLKFIKKNRIYELLTDEAIARADLSVAPGVAYLSPRNLGEFSDHVNKS